MVVLHKLDVTESTAASVWWWAQAMALLKKTASHRKTIKWGMKTFLSPFTGCISDILLKLFSNSISDYILFCYWCLRKSNYNPAPFFCSHFAVYTCHVLLGFLDFCTKPATQHIYIALSTITLVYYIILCTVFKIYLHCILIINKKIYKIYNIYIKIYNSAK